MSAEQQTGRAAAERLWSFATGAYAEARVAKACLQAQDAHGFDVNLLLFAAWCASEGHLLRAAEFERAARRCAPWRSEVVEALRLTRRRWKGDPERKEEYAAVKELELAAERRQLSMLAELAEDSAVVATPDPVSSHPAAGLLATNLAAAAAAQHLDPAVLGDLRQALGAAAPVAQSAARNPPDW